MPSLESRLSQLENRMTSDKVMPYLFLIGESIEQAQTEWAQANKQTFPTDRPCVLFTIISSPSSREAAK